MINSLVQHNKIKTFYCGILHRVATLWPSSIKRKIRLFVRKATKLALSLYTWYHNTTWFKPQLTENRVPGYNTVKSSRFNRHWRRIKRNDYVSWNFDHGNDIFGGLFTCSRCKYLIMEKIPVRDLLFAVRSTFIPDWRGLFHIVHFVERLCWPKSEIDITVETNNVSQCRMQRSFLRIDVRNRRLNRVLAQ